MDIGLQTFTVRREAQKDVLGTFKTLKSLGFNHIELAYVALDEKTIQAIQETGLKVSAIQATFSKLSNDFDEIITFAKKVNCHTVVVSVLPMESILFGKKSIEKFSYHLNLLGQRYDSKGFQLGFHHHAYEFKRIDGKTKLDLLLSLTHSSIGIVSDTYWTKKAGYKPIEVLQKIGNRLLGVHLRDIHKNRRKDTILGKGIIDFREINNFLKHHKAYQVIEQNSKHPLSDIKQSINNLEKIKKQFSVR
jgi:sugar phosphate isomerase/epimerase